MFVFKYKPPKYTQRYTKIIVLEYTIQDFVMEPLQVRKRVPKCLTSELNRREIKKTFNNQREVNSFNSMLQYGVDVFKASGVLINDLKPYIRVTKVVNLQTFDDIIPLYLAHSKSNVSKKEYKARVSLFTELLPTLMKYLHIPTTINKVTSAHLYSLTTAIGKLPNRRLYRYRALNVDELVRTKTTEIQSIASINKKIKRVRTFIQYGHSTGLYTLPNTMPVMKEKYSEKGNREPLTAKEYTLLYEKLNKECRLLLNTIYYSGMRNSEVHKATIETVDGVLVFNLSSCDRLKTKSSYRIIPIHSSIDSENISKLNIRWNSIQINRTIKKLFPNKQLSLYSARHSFITNLINSNVPPHIVSELAGHSNKSMTLSNYFGGTELAVLSSYVELL